MKFSDNGYPLIVLSHRREEFLFSTLAAIQHHAKGIGEVHVVDDSGDSAHREWLADHGFNMTAVDVSRNAGYLEAMKTVWSLAAGFDSQYTMLWEEDFVPIREFNVSNMAEIMDRNVGLAHLNLQRQSVYKVEKRLGYMESHERRGYGLTRMYGPRQPEQTHSWVARVRPFTTNPGLIRREVAREVQWPSRYVCDQTPGGAEPAMSRVLEAAGWYFGWYGTWNTQFINHIGTDLKSGTGY